MFGCVGPRVAPGHGFADRVALDVAWRRQKVSVCFRIFSDHTPRYHLGLVPQERTKSYLLEMAVARECAGDSALFHHDKRDAVGQRPAFVVA